MAPSIRIGSKPTDKRHKTSISELLFLLCGVCGLLSALQDLPGAEWNMPVVYAAAIIMSTALWYTYAWGKGWFAAVFLLIIAACGFAEFRYWDLLGSQIAAVIRSLTGGAAETTVDITPSMLILSALLTLLLFLCEIWIKNSLPVILLAVLFILCGPVIGLQPNYAAIVLLGISLCSFAASHGPHSRRGRIILAGSLNRHPMCKRGIAAGVAVCIAFGAAVPLALRSQDTIYEAVYTAEGALQRAIRNMTGIDAIAISDGRISRGNRYPTGTVQMELVANRPPTQPLYLRGFTGADYTNGEWTAADSQTLSNQIWDNLSQGPASWSMAGINYHNMYFLLNLYSEEERPNFITIQPRVATNYGNYYEPYFSRWSENWFIREGYSFQYFQPEQMHINWDTLQVQNGWLRVIAQRIQDAYMSAAETLYTSVPTGQLPRLAALCADNPRQNTEDITSFILDTLHSRAVYSTTPGLAPLNEDIVEYFLFENGEGYCVHFAAAATLMYRLYGIPARYASGYMVQPEDFEQQEDGLYHALVTDAEAHAWTELFVENQGWTPVEVTPAAEAETFDTVESDAAAADMQQETETPQAASQQADTGSDRVQEENAQPETDAAAEEAAAQQPASWQNHALAGLAAALLLAAVIGMINLQRRWRLRKARRGGCRVIFDRMLAVLSYAGKLQNFTGHEPDFAVQLCEAVPRIHQAEAQELVSIVSRASFSAQESDDASDAFAWKIYERVSSDVCQTLSPLRRIVFCFIKAFR